MGNGKQEGKIKAWAAAFRAQAVHALDIFRIHLEGCPLELVTGREKIALYSLPEGKNLVTGREKTRYRKGKNSLHHSTKSVESNTGKAWFFGLCILIRYFLAM